MPRLPGLSSQDVVRALRRAGCISAPRRGKGSHQALIRKMPDGGITIVIVPKRKSLPRGTLRAILRQVGLTVDEFADLL